MLISRIEPLSLKIKQMTKIVSFYDERESAVYNPPVYEIEVEASSHAEAFIKGCERAREEFKTLYGLRVEVE